VGKGRLKWSGQWIIFRLQHVNRAEQADGVLFAVHLPKRMAGPGCGGCLLLRDSRGEESQRQEQGEAVITESLFSHEQEPMHSPAQGKSKTTAGRFAFVPSPFANIGLPTDSLDPNGWLLQNA